MFCYRLHRAHSSRVNHTRRKEKCKVFPARLFFACHVQVDLPDIGRNIDGMNVTERKILIPDDAQHFLIRAVRNKIRKKVNIIRMAQKV